MTYHPWRRVRAMQQIEVESPILAWPTLALTDGYSRIEIDRRLTQAGRRCALDHELAHIDLGHVGGCGGRQEAAARRLSSRRLLPLPALVAALTYTTDLDYASWDLWVTRDVLDDRLAALSDTERMLIMDATAHHRDAA